MQMIFSVILSSFLICIIYILQIFFSNTLTARTRCILWLPVFLILFFGFLPLSSFHFFIPQIITFTDSPSFVSPVFQTLPAANEILDAAVNVQRFPLWDLCSILWMLGVFISFFFCCIKYIRLYKIYKHSYTANENLINIFQQQQVLFPKMQTIQIYETSQISSAMTFGIIRPKIFLPSDFSNIMTNQELSNILLHEQIHIKHKDSVIQFFLMLFHCIYWFHPLFPFFKKQIRLDHEIYCDSCVLNYYNDSRQTALYGHTLLHAAEYMKKQTLSASSFFIDSKKQLHIRILKICQPQSGNKNISRIFIFFILCLSLTSIPVLNLYSAKPDFYYLSAFEKQHMQELKTAHKIQGSLVIYREQTGQYLVYGNRQAQTRVSPNSTYKIYSAVHALENNIITPKYNSMDWNQTNYPFEQWNQNQTLNSAMSQSVNWYFQNLDQTSGPTEMKNFYKQIQYGNQNLSGGISEYWLESSLKISPWEQVRLLKDFYQNKYQWKSSTISNVKKSLLIQKKNGTRLYGKTGTGMVNGQYVHGWFIGFVEHQNGTDYFALCLTSGKEISGTKAMETVLKILQEQEIYS